MIVIIVMLFYGIVLLTLWSCLGGFLLYRIWSNIRTLLPEFPKVGIAIEGLRSSADELKLIPKVLQGHLKIAQRQVTQYELLHKAIGKFTQVIAPMSGKDAPPPLIKYDEDTASREFDVQQLMEFSGVDREQAETIVANSEDWRAQAMGVEE